MKTLRELLINRISNLGGELPEFYVGYSDHDLLDDYENLLVTHYESLTESNKSNLQSDVSDD